MARGCLEMLAAVFHNTASVDQCCNLTPVTSVTTFKNWWQLGFHPKFAIDTLSFYSVKVLTSQKRYKIKTLLLYRTLTLLYRLMNSGNSDDLERPLTSCVYCRPFKCDFSHSCPAVDKISTDIIPLR